jgi:cytidylate kinase
MPMSKITISGEPGCGKTTVARLVADRLSIPYVSTGALQRELAAERGLTTLELNLISESDPTVDSEIDSRTIKLAAKPSGMVVDSRLAWRFLPRSLKVFIVCPAETAGRRVFDSKRNDEIYADAADAARALSVRFSLECKRFFSKYNADLRQLRNYDLIVDSSMLLAKHIAAAIVSVSADPSLGKNGPTVFLSPAQIYPTADVGTVDRASLRQAREALPANACKEGELPPIDVVRLGDHWFCTGRHDLLAASLDAGRVSVRCSLVGQNDEVVDHRQTARRLVLDRAGPAQSLDWEAAFGFRYAMPPDLLFSELNQWTGEPV